MERVFQKDAAALNKMYEEGLSPDPDELQGDYDIQMLTGIIPDFSRIGHIKRFYHYRGDHTVNIVSGHNVFAGKLPWGYFLALKEQWSRMETVINYGSSGNWFSGRIRDTLSTVEAGRVYLGKFHLVIFGKPRFFGFFSMIKKN